MVKFKVNTFFCAAVLSTLALGSCGSVNTSNNTNADSTLANNTTSNNPTVQPIVSTDTVLYDSDDPAIWINPEDKSKSLIIGTDKDKDGGLYVYDLNGKELKDKTIRGIKRPNNVDLEYGLLLAGKPTDFVITTERFENRIRIFSVPDMKPIDNGGIPVFVGDTGKEYRAPMGISIYKDPKGQIYAIVGRKTGPSEGYLFQYALNDDGTGNVKATLVRKFGKYSGKKEIEAIAVDDKLGYVYYSDEQVGVRKYYADPAKGNEELALFGQGEFKGDNEGISIYETSDSTGYILVSNQQDNTFNVYPREGSNGDANSYKLIKKIPVSTNESDGSEVTNVNLGPQYPKGLFVAMSNNKTFQYYDWRDLEKFLKTE